LLPKSAVVLTECHAQNAAALAARFLKDDGWLCESLELLKGGEGILIDNSDVLFTAWQAKGG
jgi:rhodanese-related sulfurtransferase